MADIINFTPEEPQPLIRETPDAKPYPVEALGPLRSAAEAIALETEAPEAPASLRHRSGYQCP